MADSDMQLETLVAAERRREAVRVELHAQDAARHRGVAWAACSPGPMRPPSEAAIRARAADALEFRRAWAASPRGLFSKALTDCETALEQALAACDRGRAADALEFRRAWAASPRGLFSKALTDCETALEQALAACDRGRAAAARDFAAEFQTCVEAAADLENLARQLATCALAARGALSAPRPARSATVGAATTAPPPAARE
jgi:hypothetical protein